MTQEELNDLKHRFNYHAPKDASVIDAHQAARTGAYELAKNGAQLLDEVPGRAGREKALFLTKIEEALFWLNAGIARGNAEPQSEAVDYR